MECFEIRFKYGNNYKLIYADNKSSAERMYQKIIHFATHHYKPIHGGVALWNGKWLIKSDNF